MMPAPYTPRPLDDEPLRKRDTWSLGLACAIVPTLAIWIVIMGLIQINKHYAAVIHLGSLVTMSMIGLPLAPVLVAVVSGFILGRRGYHRAARANSIAGIALMMVVVLYILYILQQ